VQRLKDAGFESVAPWFQCFNFVSILAVRSAAPAHNTPKLIYKVCSRVVWEEIRLLQSWNGSPHDLRDGFIHFSTATQLAETVRRHYSDQSDLLVLEVATSSLGDALRWEPSRGGQLFPHLFGPMPISLVVKAEPLDHPVD
jgi:uncharacterized protein (DUF952 family)